MTSASCVLLGWLLFANTSVASDPGTAMHRPRDDSSAPSASDEPNAVSLLIDIRTRHDEGAVFCALWPNPEGFPVDRKRAAYEGHSEAIDRERTQIRLDAVSPGTYALACFHDENGNGGLDTNFLGIPAEGTGASNDARGLMGPPKFEDARFSLSQDGPERLRVQIEY